MNLGRSPLGDFVPASYPIPANPVVLAFDQAKTKKSSMGLFVPAMFNEPENPIRRAASVVNSSSNAVVAGTFNAPKTLRRPQRNAVIDAHMRLKASGPLASGAVGGMGGIDTSSFSNFITSVQSGTSFGVSNLIIVGAGLALLFFSGGKARGRRG